MITTIHRTTGAGAGDAAASLINISCNSLYFHWVLALWQSSSRLSLKLSKRWAKIRVCATTACWRRKQLRNFIVNSPTRKHIGLEPVPTTCSKIVTKDLVFPKRLNGSFLLAALRGRMARPQFSPLFRPSSLPVELFHLIFGYLDKYKDLAALLCWSKPFYEYIVAEFRLRCVDSFTSKIPFGASCFILVFRIFIRKITRKSLGGDCYKTKFCYTTVTKPQLRKG